MPEEYSMEELDSFFEDYDQLNPMLILFFMVISLGLYLIYWMYNLNIKLELLDEDAPDSKRCISILIFLPTSWFLIIFFLEYFFLGDLPYFIHLKVLGWAFITYLSLKYFYDFCLSFAKVTNSNGLIWYLCIYPGYFSVVLIPFNFYNTLSLILFPIFTIPVMQYFLNKKLELVNNRIKSKYFNSLARKKY